MVFFLLGLCSLVLAANFSAYTYATTGSALGVDALSGWGVALGVNLAPLVGYHAIQLYLLSQQGDGQPWWISQQRTSALCYVMEPGHLVDLLSAAGVIVVVVMRTDMQAETTGTYILAAAVALMLWAKVLFYLQGRCARPGLGRQAGGQAERE